MLNWIANKVFPIIPLYSPSSKEMQKLCQIVGLHTEIILYDGDN